MRSSSMLFLFKKNWATSFDAEKQYVKYVIDHTHFKNVQFYTVFRSRIRMYSGFFTDADPDQDFKNPDPSYFCFPLLEKK